ncbi:MAG: hypothetical protein ACH37Z_12225 [Anaerolineae bacterium]
MADNEVRTFEAEETGFDRNAFLDRMTGRGDGRERAEEVDIPDDPPEDDDEETPGEAAAPEGDEQPDQDEPDKDNSDTGSEPREQPDPLIGGKFKSQDDLLQAYNHGEKRSTQLSQALRESQWQAQQLQTQLAQVQQQSAQPPRLEDLPEAEQLDLEREAHAYGVTAESLYAIRCENQRQQAAAQSEHNARAIEQRQQQWTAEAESVIEYAASLEEFAEPVMQQLTEMPELFEALRGMSPESVGKAGRQIVDLLKAKAENVRIQAQSKALQTAAHRNGRDEAHSIRLDKVGARTETSRAGTVPQQARDTPSRLTPTERKVREMRDSLQTGGAWD